VRYFIATKSQKCFNEAPQKLIKQQESSRCSKKKKTANKTRHATPISRPVSMIFLNYNPQPLDRRALSLVVVHALIVARNSALDKPN
jgi:hypothetical protein